jgi:hypothetical protein
MGGLSARLYYTDIPDTVVMAGVSLCVGVSTRAGTNRLVRDQRYWTDHDAGMPMPD